MSVLLVNERWPVPYLVLYDQLVIIGEMSHIRVVCSVQKIAVETVERDFVELSFRKEIGRHCSVLVTGFAVGKFGLNDAGWWI